MAGDKLTLSVVISLIKGDLRKEQKRLLGR